jgi:hypothetical protein
VNQWQLHRCFISKDENFWTSKNALILHSMKFAILFVFGFFSVSSLRSQDSQTAIDSALAAKITVSGFCLCHTTVADLRHLDSNFAEVTVEEMDLGKRCVGEDGRFVNGRGYYSDSFPGMIFQKDQDADYISKIRLAWGFRGKLPDGSVVDMGNLRLKDIFNMYPGLKHKWGSRGCSDFWSFSNDTLAFYVRVDTTKKPQYPVDEAYYLDRPVDGIDLVISCYGVFNQGNTISLVPPGKPAYFLDSIRTNEGFLKASGITPSEIAFLKVYKGANAIARAGKDGTNGVIEIITKSFAREHYWEYFKSKSVEYRNKVPNLKGETDIIYVLNGKTLDKDRESELFAINDDNLIGLDVIGRELLEKAYKIHGKAIGVVIKTKENVPK